MARTKQTAKRSSGGTAPRRQLATRSFSSSSTNNNGNDEAKQQVDIFNERGTRTIMVEGTSEFYETPDIVHLSFLVEEVSDTVEEGIQQVIQKISQVRSIASDDCGVPNSNISSDSIGSKMLQTEYGVYKKNNNRDFVVRETKITYQVKSVVRIVLEGDNVQELFGKVCYKIMSESGLRTHEAPQYDLSDLTNLRNSARKAACENAKEKATAILDALQDPTVKLGRPITLTDFHCDIEDDASESFFGNITHVQPWQTTREVIDETNKEPTRKRARLSDGGRDKNNKKTETTPRLDEETAKQIFVVPPTKIVAQIKALFEIEEAKAAADDDGTK